MFIPYKECMYCVEQYLHIPPPLHSDKDLNTAKEREATLHEDRARLELQWRHRCLEHRGLLETNSTKNKEKDRELK